MGEDWEIATIRRLIKAGSTYYITLSSSFIPSDIVFLNLFLTPLRKEEWGRRVAVLTKKLGRARVNRSYKIVIPRNIVEFLGSKELWVRVTGPSPIDGIGFEIPYISTYRSIYYQESSFRVSISKPVLDRLAEIIDWSGYVYVAARINGEYVETVRKPLFTPSQNRYYISLPFPEVKRLADTTKRVRARVIIAPLPKDKLTKEDYTQLWR